MSALEDLVVENRKTYSPELRNARAVPRDYDATEALKKDADRMARLAELAEVDAARIADVAVRGLNVTFMVADDLDGEGQPTGALSSGYFKLADLGEPRETVQVEVTAAPRSSKRSATSEKDDDEARARGAKAPSTTRVGTPSRPGATTGGTATVPTAARGGAKQQPVGVPGNIDELSGAKVAELLEKPPEGVDPRAVWLYEQANREKPRTAVERAAKKLNLDARPAGVGGASGDTENPGSTDDDDSKDTESESGTT